MLFIIASGGDLMFENFEKPCLWVGITPRGVNQVVFECETEIQEAHALGVYANVRSLFQQINILLQKKNHDQSRMESTPG